MSNIVSRLREIRTYREESDEAGEWCGKAADEIERLRAALKPFGALLDTDSNGYESSADNEIVRSVGTFGRDYAVITVGDLRRAAEALNQQ